jgi:hypothetical protein
MSAIAPALIDPAQRRERRVIDATHVSGDGCVTIPHARGRAISCTSNNVDYAGLKIPWSKAQRHMPASPA